MALGLSKVGPTLAIVVVSMLWISSLAQQISTRNCMPTIVTLAPCLSYIQGSASTAPTSSCCSALAKVVASRPECLCTLLDGGIPSLGIKIDRTKALALPGACKVQTPPVSRCSEVTGSPAAEVTGAPDAAPSANAPVPGKSK